MTSLQLKIKQIIKDEIHCKKVEAKINHDQWKILDIEKMGDNVLEKIIPLLEAYAYLPCCHTSGMHDPEHFRERKYICSEQKSEAFERFAKDLGINPEVKSKLDCYWCKTNPEYRKGEGLKLFKEEDKNVKSS